MAKRICTEPYDKRTWADVPPTNPSRNRTKATQGDRRDGAMCGQSQHQKRNG